MTLSTNKRIGRFFASFEVALMTMASSFMNATRDYGTKTNSRLMAACRQLPKIGIVVSTNRNGESNRKRLVPIEYVKRE